jgi:hypothetical protein
VVQVKCSEFSPKFIFSVKKEMIIGGRDRVGSREGKKSLRKNKIAIVEKVKHANSTPAELRPTKSLQREFGICNIPSFFG